MHRLSILLLLATTACAPGGADPTLAQPADSSVDAGSPPMGHDVGAHSPPRGDALTGGEDASTPAAPPDAVSNAADGTADDTADAVDAPDIEEDVAAASDAFEPDGSWDAGPPPCPPGVTCVDSFPFTTTGDTATLPLGQIDSYDCKPTADESGPEALYRVELAEPGFLSAAVTDPAGTDVDVHILSALSPDACIDRGDHHARSLLPAGTYWVVVDTWVDAGLPLAGPYTLDIGLVIPSSGLCAMETGIMERVGDGGDLLQMPATGPIVMEAHLVTADEPPPYPATPTEELAEHYALTQAVTGYVMHRTQVWAPLEGGSFYGAGIGEPAAFPSAHEAFYVNMYWTKASRPPKGTRMILRLPDSDLAVVVAAGYETGPGDLAKIGGTTEETHFFLGTTHKSVMTLGIATDQTLPFGPRLCE